jgi:hypothetical protein
VGAGVGGVVFLTHFGDVLWAPVWIGFSFGFSVGFGFDFWCSRVFGEGIGLGNGEFVVEYVG